MNRNELTEAGLERILRDSRFPNEKHKTELFERIFGRHEQSGFQDNRKVTMRKAELLPEELEMVAGGRGISPEVRKEEIRP